MPEKKKRKKQEKTKVILPKKAATFKTSNRDLPTPPEKENSAWVSEPENPASASKPETSAPDLPPAQPDQSLSTPASAEENQEETQPPQISEPPAIQKDSLPPPADTPPSASETSPPQPTVWLAPSDSSENPDQKEPAATQAEPNQAVSEPKKSKKTVPLILFLLLIILAVVFIVLFATNKLELKQQFISPLPDNPTPLSFALETLVKKKR